MNHYIDLNRYITNLSSKTLTSTQKRVLSLGLKFIPSSPNEQDDLRDTYTNFQRNIRLKYFFRNSAPKEPHPFKGKSNWDPPRASREIKQYLERVKQGLESPNLLPLRYNLTKTTKPRPHSSNKVLTKAPA